MTDELRHWIGALLIAAAMAAVGAVTASGGDETADTVGNGLLALALLVGVIALIKIAGVLMRPSR